MNIHAKNQIVLNRKIRHEFSRQKLTTIFFFTEFIGAMVAKFDEDVENQS